MNTTFDLNNPDGLIASIKSSLENIPDEMDRLKFERDIALVMGNSLAGCADASCAILVQNFREYQEFINQGRNK